MKSNQNQSSVARVGSNVLLCILPALRRSDPEVKFWCSVARHAKEHGLEFVLVGTEPISTAHVTSIVLPREPTELERMLSISSELPANWVSSEFLEAVLEREYLRGTAREKSMAAYRGLVRLANLAESMIRILRPRLVITWDKIIHTCALFNLLARYYSIPSLIVERAPLNDRLWVEPTGLHAESILWGSYVHQDDSIMSALGDEISAELRENVYGFRKPSVISENRAALTGAPGAPLLLLPMDGVIGGLWLPRRHPLSKLKYPLYADPREALEHLGQIIQNIGGRLIVKKHPTCGYVRPEIMPHGVEYVDSDLAQLLGLADAVVCFCTKVAFPALALGKPVITLSPNIAACSGATYHCERREDVESTLRCALSRVDLQARLKRVSPFFAWLASNFFYTYDDSLANNGKGPREFVLDLLRIDASSSRLRPMFQTELSKAVSAIHRLVHREPDGKTRWSSYVSYVRASLGKAKCVIISLVR